LTHDNQTPAPVPVPAEQPAQDVSLSVLTMAYPAFRFSFLSAGFHRAKWLGLRRKPATPGPQDGNNADLAEAADSELD
jgi:hypothetical protein